MKTLKKWQIKNSELVLDNRWAKVRRDTCVSPNRNIIDDYYYWEGSDFAQVFALTAQHEVVLVRQYKHPARDVVLEFPAGLLMDSDEEPISCAQRELREETGYEATDWRSLGVLNVSSGKATTKAYCFLALGATKVTQQQLDTNEQIEVLTLGIPELLRQISCGGIRDSNSVATSLLALMRLGSLKLRETLL
jgi:8-oxo-dGTP pyrophosphatase MutT (NUDIX family)